MTLFLFVFFFSSRRRHTRCLSDWSSDVCSSDLAAEVADVERPRRHRAERLFEVRARARHARVLGRLGDERSEERRVGKERRSRWSRYHSKKKKAEKTKRSTKRANIERT